VDAGLTRSRWSAAAIFLLYGILLGTWTSRIPAVKAHLQLSDSRLSWALLAFAAGAIAGMQGGGRIVDRLGAGRVLLPAVALDAVALVLPGWAGSLALLVVALLAFGLVHGVLNVAMNVNAVEVQTALGRPIISSCHAVYSIGGFCGAAIGGLFAYAGRGAVATFLGASALVLLLAVVVAPATRRSRAPRRDADEIDGTPVTGVVFLGLLAFCCLVGEGAAADWSAVYLRDTLGTSAAFAASAYACFAVMMTAGRLVGDRLAQRFGAVALARAGGALASVGLAVCLLVDRPVAGVVGFGCLGGGLSFVAPQVFAAAGLRNPTRAGAAIGRVAGLGFVGFVVGPVVIGALSQLAGLAWALVLPALLAAFVAAAAGALAVGTRAVPVCPETTRQN
jgi:predicted MFS family arabinose efflux permease